MYLENDLCFHLSIAHANATLQSQEPSPQVSYSAGNSSRGNTTCYETGITPYRFSASTVSTSDNGPEITVNIAAADLDNIKAIINLAVSSESTYLSLSANSISDMVNNSVVELNGTTACPVPCLRCDCPMFNQHVALYTEDDTSPELLKVALNMDDEGMLVFSFSETVNVSTVDVAALTVQSKKAWDGATETHTFSEGEIVQDSNTVVTYLPTVDEMNKIKEKRVLAIDADSTFFSIASNFVIDMNNKNIAAINSSKALRRTTTQQTRRLPTWSSLIWMSIVEC
jgi:hypothetical protein